MTTISNAGLAALVSHLRRYQTEQSERALAAERLRAAFGEDVRVTADDTKIINPAMAVAGN